LFFERPSGGERAVLVSLRLEGGGDDDPQEFLELVRSAGAETVALVSGSRAQPHPRYFVGEGKLQEIADQVQAHEAEVVIFNHSLSPSQERNAEKVLRCRVLDRTRLILDIFAQRARTHEGKLQVELAQLQHMSTRLVRGWTHLERQKGGIGLRGPGETQLETDRRLLRERLKSIGARLEKVRAQRAQGRRARSRAEIPTIALVGYTNAGKSTLFNSLTDSDVYAEDQLFATLDPTLRRLQVPELGPVVLSDTVGFIRHLPHKLVEAFRATLEEASSARLLLHVVDAADPDHHDQAFHVREVLAEIGAGGVPCLEVYNKIDRLPGMEPRVDLDELGMPTRVWLSARDGRGLALLLAALAQLIGGDMAHHRLALAPAMGKLRARLYACGAVLNEKHDDKGACELEIRMPRAELDRLLATEQLDPRILHAV